MADKVFINGRAAVHKDSAGSATFFPDVCLCPPGPPAGPIPTPLPNQIMAADLQGGAKSVLIDGNPSGKLSSYFGKSTGNEVSRATGGGVISATVQGKAYFVTGSFNVLIEGEQAVRHLDLMTGNHAAKSPPNTPPAPWLSSAAPPGRVPLPPAIEPPAEKQTAGTKDILRLALHQSTALEWRGKKYRLSVGSEVFAGQLAAAATIRVRIPKGSKSATLEILDEGSSSLLNRWTLEIGQLAPATSVKGVQERLINLGYGALTPSGSIDAPTRCALVLFQRTHALEPTGDCDTETTQRIEVAHDAGLFFPEERANLNATDEGDLDIGYETGVSPKDDWEDQEEEDEGEGEEEEDEAEEEP